MKTPISMSNRHIHLSQEDANILFGNNYELTPIKELSQPGQFASEEIVTIKGPKWEINKVRILWPYRLQTQVEILMWDNFKLGTKAPIKMSGELKNTEAIEIFGPMWSISLTEWLIVAQRHIHMNNEEAKKFGVKNEDVVNVKVEGKRGLEYTNVAIRVSNRSALDMHIDTEEWNAAGLSIKWAEWEVIN